MILRYINQLLIQDGKGCSIPTTAVKDTSIEEDNKVNDIGTKLANKAKSKPIKNEEEDEKEDEEKDEKEDEGKDDDEGEDEGEDEGKDDGKDEGEDEDTEDVEEDEDVYEDEYEETTDDNEDNPEEEEGNDEEEIEEEEVEKEKPKGNELKGRAKSTVDAAAKKKTVAEPIKDFPQKGKDNELSVEGSRVVVESKPKMNEPLNNIFQGNKREPNPARVLMKNKKNPNGEPERKFNIPRMKRLHFDD